MSDLVTPTGELVYDGPPHTEEWYAVRRQGITGTDLPKLLGISKYGNELHVYLQKVGSAPEDEAGEPAQWGTILEDPVAREWARRHDVDIAEVGVIAHHRDTWRRASLDRLVVGPCPDGDGDNVCGLEVKTRNGFVAWQWANGVPDDVLAQVSWGLAVTGLHHMHVATLLGGQRLVSFRVDRDDALELYLQTQAQAVWDCIVEGIQPEVFPDGDGVLLGLLDQLFADRDGTVELPVEAEQWITQYDRAGEAEKEAKYQKEQAKTALVQMLGAHEIATFDGAPVLTYRKPDPSDRITADDLARLKVISPRRYANLRKEKIITTTAPGPRFTRKRPRKSKTEEKTDATT